MGGSDGGGRGGGGGGGGGGGVSSERIDGDDVRWGSERKGEASRLWRPTDDKDTLSQLSGGGGAESCGRSEMESV